MGLFDNWPYSDVHQLNLDWILKTVKEVKGKTDEIDAAVESTQEYSESAQQSAEQAEEALETFREELEHWQIPNGSVTDAKLSQEVIDEINFTASVYKFGGLEGVLSSPQLRTYSGNTYTIDNTLDISANDTADQYKTIANARIILNADLLTWDSGYRQLPTFVNCVFWGNGHNIVADGKYISTAKFINCVFYNCGLIHNATYAQGVRFIGCRFAGTTDIITGANCGDVVFDTCQGESDFKARLINMMPTDIKNAVDHLRLSNCIFEGNNLTELIVFTDSASIEIDGCYFESYPQGILKANSGTQFSVLVINITNCKGYECGNPAFYIDSSYSGLDITVTFNACRWTASAVKALMNRYDMFNYCLTDSVLESVTADKVTSLNKLEFAFATDSNNQISAVLTLKPLHLYYVMQARATYTGFILYAVITSNSGIVFEKLFDSNNRWTVTDEGSLTMKIVSTGYGAGRLVDMGRVG